jgi:hypothetical protein
MFFFLTLYMQNVLGYSPIKTGLAYLPLCFAVGFAATGTSRLLSRTGTRPVIAGGAVIIALWVASTRGENASPVVVDEVERLPVR